MKLDTGKTMFHLRVVRIAHSFTPTFLFIRGLNFTTLAAPQTKMVVRKTLGREALKKMTLNGLKWILNTTLKSVTF